MAAEAEIGWDHPDTARYYEAFCSAHTRYQEANRELVRQAAIEPGQRLLDVGAGTGRTAEEALARLGEGSVLCVEPAAAMREVGRQRLADSRVRWSHELPAVGAFDRILCGASFWLLLPAARAIGVLRSLLGPGGALCFNMPSLYLGRPDRPGEGRDPLLLELPRLLASSRAGFDGPIPEPPPTVDEVERLLAAAGLRATRWELELRLTQVAYRDWLKIPVITNVYMAGWDADARAQRIDEACAATDPSSWRWEHWTGWTAWADPDGGMPAGTGRVQRLE